MAEEKEKPLTRKDVLQLIKQNGGTANGLDLSGRIFEKGIDLSGLDFQFINLQQANLEDANLQQAYLGGANLQQANLGGANLQQAKLPHANLQQADLMHANLQQAKLWKAQLQHAILWGANLRGADLDDANLEGAYGREIKLSPETTLETVLWGDYILGEERVGDFDSAQDAYRRFKQWYTDAGMYDIAGEFFYREMEAKRKAQSWKRKLHLKLWSWVMRLLCGYGEKPERVIISAGVVIFGLAAAYYLWGSFSSSSFWDTLYYSTASFTALGYGQWAPQPTGWAKGMGVGEAVIGVSMMALFLVTFTRKMTR